MSRSRSSVPHSVFHGHPRSFKFCFSFTASSSIIHRPAMEFVTLSNGHKMPIIGLGTWLHAGDDAQFSSTLETALRAGYRHFDTAYVYGDAELVLGSVFRNWIASGAGKREDLFITTKLPFCGMTPEKVGHFLNLSLQRLGLEYVDMYLVHVPFGVKYKSDLEPVPFVETPEGGRVVDIDPGTELQAVWSEMEVQAASGRARSIGVSNFDVSQLERVLSVARIPPANVQVELHAYLQQKELRAFCTKQSIVVSAYAPFASPGRGDFYSQIGLLFEPAKLAENVVVRRVAAARGKTPWQVLLRFLTQLDPGIVVLPKSSNEGRMKENLAALDFKLTAGEMKELEGLDMPGGAGRTFRFEFLPGVEAHPEFPVCMKKL